MSEVNYYTIKKCDGEFSSDINRSEFIGLGAYGFCSEKLSAIRRFVQVTEVFGYYGNVIEYLDIPRTGRLRGNRECSIKFDFWKLEAEGNSLVCGIDECKAYYLKKTTYGFSIKKGDFIGIDKEGKITFKLDEVDSLTRVDSDSYDSGTGLKDIEYFFRYSSNSVKGKIQATRLNYITLKEVNVLNTKNEKSINNGN